ncbi:hypothetical protein CsatA_009917 [Cannabis sativa]
MVLIVFVNANTPVKFVYLLVCSGLNERVRKSSSQISISPFSPISKHRRRIRFLFIWLIRSDIGRIKCVVTRVSDCMTPAPMCFEVSSGTAVPFSTVASTMILPGLVPAPTIQ